MAMLDHRTGAMAATGQPDAVIYEPARGVMQAGARLTRQWILEFAPREGERLDPPMGWPGSGDTRQEIIFLRTALLFPSRRAAESYAKRHGLSYAVEPPPREPIRPKTYADNFRATGSDYGRIDTWARALVHLHHTQQDIRS